MRRFAFFVLPVVFGSTSPFDEDVAWRALEGYEADMEDSRMGDEVFTAVQPAIGDGGSRSVRKRTRISEFPDNVMESIINYRKKRISKSPVSVTNSIFDGIPAVEPSVLHREFIEKRSTGWTEWLYTYSDGHKGTVLTRPRSKLLEKK